MTEKLYISHPGVGRTFHVFRESDDRSLCGRYGMLRKDPKQCSAVTGNETWRKGQDCKPCFRAAGLLREDRAP